MSDNIRHYHTMTRSLSLTPDPPSTMQSNLASRRTNLAQPQWKSGIWDIDTSSRMSTLELLQDKFILLDCSKRDYVGGAQGAMHKLWVDSLYIMFNDMFYHYSEHCEDLADTLEKFAMERGWPKVPEAEVARVKLYRGLIDEIAEWSDLLEQRYEDGDFRDVLGFFDEVNEILEVKYLLRRVKNELMEDMAENYVSPTTTEIARLSLVAQMVQNTRDGGVWGEKHRYLEMMVSMHLGDDDEDPLWFESIFEIIVWRGSRKGEEDQSSKDFRAKSEDFLRNIVREMETALESNPEARGQNIYGVLEERNEEACNRARTGRPSNYGRELGDENRQPVAQVQVQVQVQVEEIQNHGEDLTFI